MDIDIYKDAFNLICGDRIGSGISREVFEYTITSGYVVKVETTPTMFQNIMEMLIWRSVVGTKASRWFAECKWISPNGRILIQERTRQPANAELLSEVPVWFSDIKIDNWGMVPSDGGSDYLVCHDYGYNLTIEKGTKTTRMQKVEW